MTNAVHLGKLFSPVTAYNTNNMAATSVNLDPTGINTVNWLSEYLHQEKYLHFYSVKQRTI
jgi:hypothetical protein